MNRGDDFSGLRVLVIDESAPMRRIVRTLLNTFGARDVIEAGNGGEGLARFFEQAPDLVITDLAMPIIDGIELTQMIRQPHETANARTPIIMLTSQTARPCILAARDAGVTEVVANPVWPKALRARIASSLRNPRPFVSTTTFFGPDRRRSLAMHYLGPDRRARHTVGAAEPARSITTTGSLRLEVVRI